MEAVGLTAARNIRGIPLVMPPQNPTVVVGLGSHAAVFYAEGVIVAAAGHGGGGEARSEFQAPDGGDAEDHLGDAVLHAPEHGVSQPGGKAQGHAHNDTPQGVSLGLGP